MLSLRLILLGRSRSFYECLVIYKTGLKFFLFITDRGDYRGQNNYRDSIAIVKTLLR